MFSRIVHPRGTVLALTIGAALCASPAIAAPGDTLTTLGQGGDGVTRASAGTSRTWLVQAVSSLVPRRIYAVGDVCTAGPPEQCTDAFIAAFDERLVLDASFGTNGFLILAGQTTPIIRQITALGIESRRCTAALFEKNLQVCGASICASSPAGWAAPRLRLGSWTSRTQAASSSNLVARSRSTPTTASFSAASPTRSCG